MSKGNKQKTWRLSSVILVLVCLFYCTGSAKNGITVSMKLPETAWSDSHLGEKLDMHLSTVNRVPISRFGPEKNLAPIGVESSFSELLKFGRDQNDRFLVDINIDRIDLEKRKITIIPCLLFRYRLYAVLTGKLRIVDITRERIVKLKDIDYEIKATDLWQLVDDNRDDAALHLPADEKITLFNRLEEEAASRLFSEIVELTKGNGFGR